MYNLDMTCNKELQLRDILENKQFNANFIYGHYEIELNPSDKISYHYDCFVVDGMKIKYSDIEMLDEVVENYGEVLF